VSDLQRRDLAAGRWWKLTIAEQLGHVGSEVSRMLRWRSRDAGIAQGAFALALELIDLTLADPRYRQSVDSFSGPNEYGSDAAGLQRCFDAHAIAASRRR
jgi:hypothetical protein